jgi:hypothetical protein
MSIRVPIPIKYVNGNVEMNLSFRELSYHIGNKLQLEQPDKYVVFWNHGNDMFECVAYSKDKFDLSNRFKLQSADFERLQFIFTGVSSKLVVFKKEVAVRLCKTDKDRHYIMHGYHKEDEAE